MDKGDTLQSLSEMYSIDYEKLLAANEGALSYSACRVLVCSCCQALSKGEAALCHCDALGWAGHEVGLGASTGRSIARLCELCLPEPQQSVKRQCLLRTCRQDKAGGGREAALRHSAAKGPGVAGEDVRPDKGDDQRCREGAAED